MNDRMPPALNLSISHLRQQYRARALWPAALAAAIREAIGGHTGDRIWIHVLSQAELEPHLARLAAADPAALPLYGIPFAIKDNIDLAGVPTTAACPAYAYTPQASAHVVQRLLDAGAIPIGKTNLDQFATGLVGTRSPYGATRNAFNPQYISGGSSSGSAVAVAKGLASFALGTDTAGSGRIPAAFNNLVGVKPTRGLLSTRGMVPACRSLDCMTVLALDMPDAQAVLKLAVDFDAEDAYARAAEPGPAARERFVFGVPATLEFFGDSAAAGLYEAAVARLAAIGGAPCPIDFAPFLAAARLLYEGPWVAERYAAIKDFIAAAPDALQPVTRAIIEPAVSRSAVEAFEAQYRLQALKREADRAFSAVDFIMTPTAGTIPTIAAIDADPIEQNGRLGRYTNFMNLLDYAAVAVPAGFRGNGLPFGVTLFGPAFTDTALLQYGHRLQVAQALPLGATGRRLTATPLEVPASSPDPLLRLAVCGAHMSGLPLNHQLVERGGRLVRTTRTAPCYRFYALPDGPPQRPGLVRVNAGGAPIEVEVWEIPASAFASFVQGVPAPLAIGTVQLIDDSSELGFVCEAYAIQGAREITPLGGWRAFLRAAE